MEKNLGKVSYLRLTSIGRIYLTEFLRGNIEPYDLAQQTAYFLAQVKRNSDSRGLTKFQKYIPNSLLLAYESAFENKLVEEVEGSFLDNVEEIIDKKWKYLDKRDVDSQFRAGLAPPPNIFGEYEEDE